jgi:drug/metabolite transporter (DMT)-like permease
MGKPTTSRLAGPIFAAVTVILWGSAFVGIRAVIPYYPPGQLALLRFLVASAALGVMAVVLGIRIPPLRDFPHLFALGAIGIAAYQVVL